MAATDLISIDVVVAGVSGQGRPLQGNQLYSQFIGFGDSNIDSGYFFTHPISNNATLQTQYAAAVAVGGGIPTSVGGVMYSTLLAQDYGLTAIPVGLPGGTNYGASGATVTGKISSSSLAPAILDQIQTYISSVGGHADSNALYLLSGGGNDATVAEALSGTAAQNAYMVQQAHIYAQAIEQLHAAGARYFIDDDRSGAGNLGRVFTQTLWSDLSAAGITFIPGQNRQNIVVAVEANPAAYGITNATQPPSGPFTVSNSYSPANGGADIDPIPSVINAGWARYGSQLVSSTAGQTFLWADDQHFASAGQQIEANYIYDLIQNAAPTVGEKLTATVNTIGGGATHQTAYQWQSRRADETIWRDIGGANGSTYTVQNVDLGNALRAVATYTDSTGSTTVVSQPSAGVATLPAGSAPGLLGSLNLAEELSAIFVGYFNRAPDPSGFNFWQSQNAHAQAPVASGGFGQSAEVVLTNIANSFTPQSETIAVYPSLASLGEPYCYRRGRGSKLLTGVI